MPLMGLLLDGKDFLLVAAVLRPRSLRAEAGPGLRCNSSECAHGQVPLLGVGSYFIQGQLPLRLALLPKPGRVFLSLEGTTMLV